LGTDVVARDDGSFALRWTGADATSSKRVG